MVVDFISLGGTCGVKVLTTSKFSTFTDNFFVAMATVIFSQRFQFFCGKKHMVRNENMCLLVVAFVEHTPQ